MSRLILKGDIASNTGEYLPAPYIDRVYINGSDSEECSYTIRASIFLSNVEGRESLKDGEIVEDKEAYRSALSNGNLYYYVMVLHNLEDTGFYEDIVDGNLNPLVLFNISGSVYSYDGDPDNADNYTDSNGNYTNMSLFEIAPLDNEPAEYYDEDGSALLKYSETIDKNLTDVMLFDTVWGDISSLRVLTFTSTRDYSKFDVTDPRKISLLDIQLGDISYENVFEGGSFGNRDNVEYMDDNGAIYGEVPLVSIDSATYKVNGITHDEIVESFEDLIEQYSEYSEEKTGYAALKKMTDNISYILETYGESANLIPELNALRRAFPNKSTVTLVGKLYKDFRQRINNINTTVKNSETLQAKVLYNSKLVDLRSLPVTDVLGPSYNPNWEAETTSYLYSGIEASKYTVIESSDSSHISSGDGVDVVCGYFFFDYEKALRQVSDISQLFDINKLEDFGLHTPYENFIVDTATISRIESDGAINIISTFDDGLDYPLTKYVAIEKDSDAVMIDPTELGSSDHPDWLSYGLSALAGTPYYGSPEEGYLTSLVFRNFINASTEDLSGIQNYRLMCFELLDYQVGSEAEEYGKEIAITDTTVDLAEIFIDSCKEALAEVEEYYQLALEKCSYNETSEFFNQFFVDGVLAQYEDDIENSPWLRAPMVYLLHLDLNRDVFGGDKDRIVKEAKSLSLQIDPSKGTLLALEAFRSAFTDFVDETYGSGSEIAENIETLSENSGNTKTFSEDAALPVVSASVAGVGSSPELAAGVDGATAEELTATANVTR